VNVEQYGGHSETLVPLIAADYKCQTGTDSTGGHGYVAERRYVTIPCHFGDVG